MKVAVYTIFKDEEKHAERWLMSCRGADYILAADTGSTDQTVEILKTVAQREGLPLVIIQCAVVPWRFDEARNFSLHALPRDAEIGVCLDMDEVLLPRWAEIVRGIFTAAPETTRLRYNYIWSWNDDGTPGLTYHADKIHRRAGYRWVGPVHEVLKRDGRETPEHQTFLTETLIEHHPDNSKPRSQYFPLLRLAAAENPHCDRTAHYLGRELYFNGLYAEAILELQRHLEMPAATWNQERAASCRYLGDAHWALGDHAAALVWFAAAKAEVDCRENHVRFAQAYRALGRWADCRDSCLKALEFRERPNGYLNDAVSWSNWPEIMLGEALAQLSSQD